MKREEVGKNSIVAQRLENTMRKLVVVLPLLAALYGVIIEMGWAQGSPGFTVELFVTLIALAVVLVTLQLAMKRSAKPTRVVLVIGYHILMFAALLFIFGATSPIAIGWIFLIIITQAFFGTYWALLSYLLFVALLTCNYTLYEVHGYGALANHILAAVFMAAVALIFASLRSLELSEHTKIAVAEAREHEQRDALLTIINGASQAIFTVSGGGIIRIYNAAFLNLLDTNASIAGRKVDDIMALYDREGKEVSLHHLMKKDDHFERDDLTLRFTDDDEIRLYLSVNKVQSAFSSLRHRGGDTYVCIARDVTKAKSLEEERDEFISVVSHELRTPVTIAEGSLSNVQFFMEKGTDAKKLAPTIKDAHEQIVLLATMINDLGTLSRAERGVGDSTEEIDIRDLVETMYKNYQEAADKKGLTLDLDTSPQLGNITTSRLYLDEMLQNLLNNAIKYTQKGSVTLSAHRTDDKIEFAVRDTGIGIGKADLKHIFEKFYRSEDYRTRESSGTGLGLYVVRKLMKKLGTVVEVKSRLNHGSTFSFVLTDKQPDDKGLTSE